MRVLIISKEGDGCGIAWRMVEEGHQVDLWIKHPDYAKALQGIVNRVESFRPYVSQADLIICDLVGFSSYAPLFSRLGKPTLGCNSMGDILELDRRRAMEVFQKVGINTPVTHYFDSPKSAATLRWVNPLGYVVKPSNNLHVSKTYLCDREEIYKWALTTLPTNAELIVQEIVDRSSAVEISTEGWYNGRDWMQPFNHTFEEKRLAVGEVGPMTGCMGNVVFPLRAPNKLVEATVMKLEPVLRKVSYKGPIDVNCLVTKDKALALEITARFGYDAIEALTHGLKGGLGSFLFDTATGIAKSVPMIGYDYLIAVRVVTTPYPVIVKDVSLRGSPVLGLEGPGGSVFPCDVYKESGKYKYASSDGVVCKVAANGRDVREAQRRVYARVADLRVQNILYRTDIGARVDRDITRLKQWGWL